MNSPAQTKQPATPKNDIASLLDEPPWRPWWRRWTLWLALALVLAAAAGFYVWRLQVASAAAPRYSTAPVTRGNITLTVTANGSIQPTRSINIGSELSGTVRQVLVDVNDQVRKGQVLLVLDTAKLRDQILRSQAAEASARGRLAQAVATVSEANASQARMEEVARLSGGKVPSKAELEAGQASVSRAVADEAIAQAGVKDAQAALSTDQTNLSKASIVAPSDGILLTRSVDPGNAVAASLQAVTLFTLADDLHKLRVWVYVDEADVGAVKLGQAASFTVSAYPTREFPARVSRVGQGSTITDNVVTYLTYLDVDNADLSLRPGMTATATITATERQDVLQVPNTALRFAPSNDGVQAAARTGLGASLIPRVPGASRRSAADYASTAGARQVWVLPADAQDGRGTPVAVAVMPGISDGHLTEITRGELQLGQQVITDQKSGQAD